ncbi:uncharacterized protein RSE6_06257 [Rhynchosporium secalis]|uniref:Protein required for cell viability n=1 Tax=Rhynchosporium secalis TaxID=38038 RepID=A0A1E1M9X0_RHYSE|nr:uncharacterized protein RSE6_06257 [Rhynchosporium secalis]
MGEELKKIQPPLVDSILQCGKQAFDPEVPERTRRADVSKFNVLVENSSTLALIPVLNLLVQPGRAQPWLRTQLISVLARLPLRPRGVQHTIEFILSVHPSTSGSNVPTSTRRGAGISHEALNAVSRLLSSPPVGVSAGEWFNGIAPQLLLLLDGDGEPDMDKVAAFVIGFGILGRKQYGAPGSPGWTSFVKPIICTLDLTSTSSDAKKMHKNSIETVGTRRISVSASEVAKGLHRLSTLLISHPHPALSKRLLRPLILPLWALSSWRHGDERTKATYCEPARKLLKILLQLSPSSEDTSRRPGTPSALNLLSLILKNIASTDRLYPGQIGHIYTDDGNGGICIEEPKSGIRGGLMDSFNVVSIDFASDSFISLLKNMPDMKSEISKFFMSLCKRWLTNTAKADKPRIVTRVSTAAETDGDSIATRFVEATVMRKLMSEFPENLVDNSHQVLGLVNQVLSDFLANSDYGDETAAVALSLLNIVLTSPSFRVTKDEESCLLCIEMSLSSISRMEVEASSTANNLLMLLKFRDAIDKPDNINMSGPTDRQVEDKKTYSLAMSYLTATDSPPPVRAQGLELLSNLIRSSSTMLDIPALLVLFSSLLQDNEEYIYLRVIKSFIQLSQKHPRSVMKDLIERYVDPHEESDLDQRLRLGEALLQVIQNNTFMFSGETSKTVCEGLLFLAGRRGYRPKTQQQQEKENKLKQKQNIEAHEAWGGEVPQLDEVLGKDSSEDSEMLAQIVAGWESERGKEDVRIRASALSILGSGIEANTEGIGSRLISTAVDLSIHILTLEPEPETGILRRAAILLIMNFVKALDSARAEGKKLSFGFVGQSLDDVRRVLEYVESTDGDGLVKLHAKDVIENLETWEMNSLIHPWNEQTEIKELAGLKITPQEDVNGRVRPRIEEID